MQWVVAEHIAAQVWWTISMLGSCKACKAIDTPLPAGGQGSLGVLESPEAAGCDIHHQRCWGGQRPTPQV